VLRGSKHVEKHCGFRAFLLIQVSRTNLCIDESHDETDAWVGPVNSLEVWRLNGKIVHTDSKPASVGRQRCSMKRCEYYDLQITIYKLRITEWPD